MLLPLLVLAGLASLGAGVRTVSPVEIWQAVTAYDPANPLHVTVIDIRLPRLWAGLVAGGALGLAGSIMQALTRNPLADPGLLGVGSGAAFAVVFGSLLLGASDSGLLSMLAFPGAAIASAAVFALGGGLRGDVGPVRLTLAGAALHALLLSLVSAVVLVRSDALDILRFWVAGSLSEAGQRPLLPMTIVAVLAAGLALAMAPVLETLSLGSGLSRGLGTRLWQAQGGALLAVTLLMGAAVAIAGPIGFLGLMVPPLARRFSGHRLGIELVASAMIGAIILLVADTAGRLILPPGEVRAGVMTAVIGGPVFVLIARRMRQGASA
jgi:iron complex transport system permease protein